jgi:lipopolysaccharide export system permease protein
MIFVRSTLREFTAAGIGVFLVLLVITFTTQLIRLLGIAASGGLPTDAVLVLLGFSALIYLPVLLSATLFLSVLLSLTRAYRDSEMVVWLSSGKGLMSWFGPALIFAAPVVLLVTLLSLYLTPWAIGKTEQYRYQMQNRDDVSAVTPGVFKESKNGERVFFVEKVSSDLTQVNNIFVEERGRGVMVAKRGYTEVRQNGDRYLVTIAGRRYIGIPGQADYRIEYADRYELRIDHKEQTSFFPTQKSFSTRQLLQNPTAVNMSEFTWRVGLPVSALVLAFLAIPLSAVNPRTGRFFNVLVAIFLYMTYSNLISIVQAWVAKGTLNPMLGMVAVHAAMVLVLAALLYKRIFGVRLLRWRQ